MNLLLKLLLLFLTISSTSCERINLEDLDNNNNADEGTDSIYNESPNDSIVIDTTIPTGVLTVAQALKIEEFDSYDVLGYMVGYIHGNSIKSGACFTLPEKINTNFLMADNPQEKDYNKCLPVKLESTGSNATRDVLNLFDHPQLLGQQLVIYGYLGTYFGQNGIIKVLNYKIVTNKDEGTNNEDSLSYPTPDLDLGTPIVVDGRACSSIL